MQKRVWFITGSSSGFGKIFCEKILEQGDFLVATARNPMTLESLKNKAKPNQLLILKLDVTSKSDIHSAVLAAKNQFGRIDVLVNNAGYGHVGGLEEINDSEIRQSFDVNVFGLFEMTRAVLPLMREQKSGFILMMSSVAGVAAIPGAGVYAATKFAVEGLSEALASEVSSFNIKVVLVEPGSFRTEFASGSLKTALPMPEYDDALAATRKLYQTIGGNQPGDPVKAVKVMMDLVNHPNPPLRIVLGEVAMKRARAKIEKYLQEIQEWEAVGKDVDIAD